MNRAPRSATLLRGLGAALVLLAAAAVVGFRFGEDYVWADRFFGHYLVLGSAAVLCGCLLAIASVRRRSRLRIVVVAASVMVCGALLLVDAIAGLGSASRSAFGDVSSPDGRFTAFVRTEPWAIDTLDLVRIRQNHGLLARQWEAGCLNEDAPTDGFASMRWTASDVLVVTTQDGVDLTVRLEPSSGRPQATVRTGVSAVCP